ncbi:MAG TPA: hypothetical protein VGL20_13900 [Candidatus Dormibacteraeota bacterium]|jgi:hypothetical protein
MQSRSGNMALAIGLVILAVIFLIAAIFYMTTDTSLLAGTTARHYKHGILALILGALCLIGANFARRPQA